MILVMTEERMERNLVRLRAEADAAWEAGSDEHAMYLETQIKCFEAAFAAMTEVDLDSILGEWLDGVVTDGGKAYSECVLAHIKEGKE